LPEKRQDGKGLRGCLASLPRGAPADEPFEEEPDGEKDGKEYRYVECDGKSIDAIPVWDKWNV